MIENLNVTQLFWVGTITCFLIVVYSQTRKNILNVESVPKNRRRVPIVPGTLPLIGHVIHFYWNHVEFMKSCYARYGGVFQIRIFRRNIIVVSDRKLASVYLKERETVLSNYLAARDCNLDWSLFNDELFETEVARRAIYKPVTFEPDRLIFQIEEECTREIEKLKLRCKDVVLHCVVGHEMNLLVTRMAMTCFTGVKVTQLFLNDLYSFFNMGQLMFVMSYILPKWILKPAFHWRFRQLKKRLGLHFDEEIQKYINDPTKCDSKLIRLIVDIKRKPKLANFELAESVLGFLFTVTANAKDLLSSLLVNLTLPENKSTLLKLLKEIEDCEGQTSSLLLSPLLHSCVMESARLSTFSIMPRKPQHKDFCLGDFYIGNQIDQMMLSPILLHIHGDGDTVYHNATKFIPDRFMGPLPEPNSWQDITTWGAGQHICPGRHFAINEIKIVLSKLLLNLTFKPVLPIPPFSLSAVKETNVKMEIRVR